MKKTVRFSSLLLIIALLVVPFSEGSAASGNSPWECVMPSNSSNPWPATSIPQALEDYYVFIASPDALTDVTGLCEGSLYKQNITTKETTLLIQGPVNAVRFFDEQIWYATENTIYRMDTDGTNSQIVCTSETVIDYFVPGDMAVLVESNNDLYRIFLKDATTNWVCTLTGIISYTPITIDTMLIETEDSDYTVNLATGQRDTYIEPDSETEEPELVPFALSNYTIAGVSIPVRRPKVGTNKMINTNRANREYESSRFRNGTYFTHNGLSEDDRNNPGESLIYPPDSTGCAAFARYVYTEIWGNENGHQHTYSPVKIYNETNIKAYYMSVPAGSNIRLRSKGGTGHSIILLSANSSSIDVYDANWDNKWGIQIKTLSYSTSPTCEKMPSKFYEIAAQRLPGYDSGDVEGHRACKEPSCSAYNTISPHVKEGAAGYGTCMVCGYTGQISMGTTSVGGGEVESK